MGLVWRSRTSLVGQLIGLVRLVASFAAQLFYRPSDAVAEEYHKWYYGNLVWTKTTYMGINCWKSVSDMWNYQEILSELQPSLVIEFGTRYGGSAVYFANIMRQIGQPFKVLTVDNSHKALDPRARREPDVLCARLAGIPYIAIANAYWSPQARRRFPLPDVPWTRFFGVRPVSILYRLYRPLIFALYCLPLNWLRRKHGLSSLGWDLCRIFTDGDYTLYADVPELVPTYNLPANHRYLGPVLWSPDVKPPTWWHSLPTDRPIIYATLGSSGGKNLLQVVLNALADLPVTVIAATAGRNHLKNVPANAFVADYLPGEAAAARSAVVLCNGGSPTTQQALAAGVPVIGLPSNMDQHLNMEALERAGAGVLLRTERLNTEGVAAAVKQVLSGAEFRQAARRLAEAFGPDFAGFPQHIESALRLVC